LPSLTVKEVGAVIRSYLKGSKDTTLIKKAPIKEMENSTLLVLCQHLSKALIAEVFGGNLQSIQTRIKQHLEEVRNAEIAGIAGEEGDVEDEFKPEPLHPQGIAGNNYATRLAQKVILQLEKIVDDGAYGSGQQAVNAARELLKQSDTIKKDALGVMEAYEKQLILLADHIVRKFLPDAGKIVKSTLHEVRDSVLTEIKAAYDSPEHIIAPERGYEMWEASIDAALRQLDRKKFELLFVESMANRPRIREAFDLTEDLIDNYSGSEETQVMLEDDATKTIQEARLRRDQIAEEIDLDKEDI